MCGYARSFRSCRHLEHIKLQPPNSDKIYKVMAPSETTTIPLAPVQHWNAYTVYVQCPFCTNIHTHGFGGSYTSILRAPHCNYHSSLSFPSYRFAYPFSTHKSIVAYKINKSSGFFVALGAKASESEVEPIEEALDELNRIWVDPQIAEVGRMLRK